MAEMTFRFGEYNFVLPSTLYCCLGPDRFARFRSFNLQTIQTIAKELTDGTRASYPPDQVHIIEVTVKEVNKNV